MESLMLFAVSFADFLPLLTTVKNLGMVAIMLGFVIFVHELGHFLVAKACGVKVEKFYIGFNFFNIPLGFFTIPATLAKVQWGETEYGIGSFPLGGYVKMLGQDDNPGNAEEESDRTKIRDEQGNVKLDPRSYPAKSVPQRMAIISAGVIMNIIFGVIFAAVAYKIGVEIQPAVIGSTSPGDPAWKANLQVEDRVLQLGKDSQRNEHMRYLKDMLLNLALYGSFDKDLDVLVRHADGEEEWVTMRPSDRQKDSEMSRPTLGIADAESTEFRNTPSPLLPLMPRELVNISYGDQKLVHVEEYSDLEQAMASRAALGLKLTSKIGSKDRLLAIDGESVKSYGDVQRLLAQRAGKPIKLTIERAPKKAEEGEAETESAAPTPEVYTLTIQPRPMRDFGVQMEATAITAVQKDSPAAKAGFEAGDRLVTFDGQPIGDPLAFPQATLAKIGETVDVQVERTVDGKTKLLTLSIPLRAPPQMTWSQVMSNAIAVETMGIAYEITNKVAAVRSGGPAEGKLKPGDLIEKVQFVAAGDVQAETEATIYGKAAEAAKEIPLDGKRAGWPGIVMAASSSRLPDTVLKATVRRGDEVFTADLSSVASSEIFLDDRNLHLALTPLTEMHVAAGWGEAFSLGAREVKERMTEVITVVSKLVTGRISATNLGGPLAIIGQATSEADRGVSDLLMFFTFLSANLAVINFLPIPALDGGHMVFLLYEGIRRKPVDENLQMRLSAAGILSLLALMLFVTMLDLYRFFG